MIGAFSLQQRSVPEEEPAEEEPIEQEEPLIAFSHGSSDLPTPVDGPDGEASAERSPSRSFNLTSQPLGEPS